MSERKVLSLPKQPVEPLSDPSMGSGMPMGDPTMMGGDMMGGMPMDNPLPMDGNGGQFDTNFDAGVEADENADPKKYIQQLTGKLSQSLRNYNDGQPQADADLNKYVAGMIVKQAIAGLSPDDVQEVLDKVKTDDDAEPSQPMDGEQQEMPMDNGGQEPMQQPFDGMESRHRFDNRRLVELTALNNQEDYKMSYPKRRSNNKSNGSYRTMPFEFK